MSDDKIKVLIEMDDGWRFWPIPEPDLGLDNDYCCYKRAYQRRVHPIEISKETYDRYVKISREYTEIRELFEHLYRHQEGLEPFLESPFHPNNVK